MTIIDSFAPMSIAEYDQRIKLGLLKQDDHVELLRGRLVPRPPVSNERTTQVRKLFKKLDQAAGAFNRSRDWSGQVLVRQGGPIALAHDSKPQPDIALLVADKTAQDRGDVDDCYAFHSPCAEETLLVIEASDAALRRARDERLGVYAEGGVREAWILDMDRKVLTVHLEPMNGCYMRVSTFSGGELRPCALPELRVALEDLLGPRL